MSEAKNTKHDPRVGLSVIAMDDPYKETQLRGRVVEHRSDSDFTVIDQLSRKYTGKFLFRDNPAERLVLVIAVERARYLALPFINPSPSMISFHHDETRNTPAWCASDKKASR
jgi:hypothetical protein